MGVLTAGAMLMASAATTAQTVPSSPAPVEAPSVQEELAGLSVDQLRARLDSGRLTSERLVAALLTRVTLIDRNGPTLRSVIALNPNALAEAQAADARRRDGRLLGVLDGIPVLIKDNIETRDQPTTAGSLALAANDTRRDAPVVAALRAQGAVILGKTNLSEWANIRSSASISGWSAVGGLVRNPYALDRTACGSSSGSGAAVAAGLAPLALGTETDGSVVCPAAMNGLAGLKPTLGLVSRTHVVPISHSQDTPGPMARSVREVAQLFGAMVASDPADPATRNADRYRRDYAAQLRPDALKGMRIGYWRPEMEAKLAARFDAALDQMRRAGAILVQVRLPESKGLGEAESLVLHTELKADLARYLATTPPAVKVRSLDDVIAFNAGHPTAEMPFFGQDGFLKAARRKGLDDPDYRAARVRAQRMAGPDGIDAMLKAADVQALVTPTYGTPWLSDPVHGDQFTGPSASELPAVAGYPHLTVPMGLVDELPVGLSFIGTAYSDGLLLNLGYAYEQISRARVAPRFLPTVPADLGPRRGD